MLALFVKVPTMQAAAIASTKDPQFFLGFQIFCGSRHHGPLPHISAGHVCKQTLQ